MSCTKLLILIVACCASFITKAQILCGVEANFYWEMNPNNVAVFNDTSQVAEGWEIVSYQWNFGDGSNSTQQNPTHFFPNPGNYEICLTVVAHNEETNETCTDIFCEQYVQCGWMEGAFTYQVQNGVVIFIASGTVQYGPPMYVWSFGDNSQMGSGPVVEHVYNGPGVYQACMTMFDANDCSYTYCQQVLVQSTSCEGINASFEYLVSGDEIYVESTSTSNGLPLDYQWSLSGEPSLGSGEVTEWVNLAPGNYTVCLSVGTMGAICNTFCENIIISDPACEGFSVEVLQDTDQEGNIVLTALPLGGTQPYFYQWNDGSTQSQVVVGPNVLGVYCVTAYDNMECMVQDCDSVNIEGGCNFYVYITAITQGNVTILQAQVEGGVGPYTYSWNGPSNGPVLTVDIPGSYCVTVADAQGCSSTMCYTVWNAPQNDTLCGYVFNDLNGNGIFNENEEGIIGGVIQLGNYTVMTNADGFWQAIVPTGTYYVYYCAGGGNIITVPSSNPSSGTNGSCANYYGVSSSTADGNCTYNFGVQLVSFNICGSVFFDADGNGEQGSNTENGLNAVQIQLTSSTGSVYQTYTNSLGDYCIYLPAGEYTITIGGTAFQSCTVAPEEITVTGVAGQSFTNQDFAVQCEPGSCNLSIEVSPNTTVTPGFPGWYNVYVCNNGTTLASGTANYFYNNAALTLNSTSPVPTTQNASTGHISWDINNLLPGQCTSFWLNFSSPVTTPLGSSVFTLASIDADCNDYNLTNNTDSLHQIVVGSWDPNNKFAYQTNHGSNTGYQWISSVDADQRIEYIINFQNTGSAPAVNVVVEDFISEDLDMSTFEVLSSSHPMQTVISGNDVNFRFNNIMLPDSTNNEPESHGFIRFAINAINGLSAGHIISDDAAIYFDFNEPVITNDAAVEMLNVVSVGELSSSSNVLVYPNPMEQIVQFKNLNGKSFRLRITDSTGRVLTDKQSTSDVYTMERGSLASGFYFYEVIEAEVVTSVGKLVVR